MAALDSSIILKNDPSANKDPGVDDLMLGSRDASKAATRKGLVPRVEYAETRKNEEGFLTSFFKVVAGMPTNLGSRIERHPRTGTEINDLKQATIPFQAERSKSGEISITFNGTEEEVRKRYASVLLVSSDKKILAIGRHEGNKVTFPDSARTPDNALIVFQERGVISGVLHRTAESIPLINKLTGYLSDYLFKRCYSMPVGLAVEASKYPS